ncbi:MAG: hypothetical protein AAF492_15790, partial [Verrucomicrobiota bacterium]
VKVPEMSKKSEGFQRPSRSRVHVPGTTIHYPMAHPTQPNRKPPKQKKKKNWITPPLPGDLKGKFDKETDETEEESSGWGWMADQISAKRKKETEEKEKQKKEDREEEERLRLEFELNENRTSFDTAFNDLFRRSESTMTFSSGESNDKRLEETLNGLDLSSEADVNKLKKEFNIQDDFNQRVRNVDGPRWTGDRSWTDGKIENNFTMKETDSILGRWQTERTSTILKENSRFSSRNSTMFSDSRLTSGSQAILNKYFKIPDAAAGVTRDNKLAGSSKAAPALNDPFKNVSDPFKNKSLLNSSQPSFGKTLTDPLAAKRPAGKPITGFSGFNNSVSPTPSLQPKTPFSTTPRPAIKPMTAFPKTLDDL